MLSGTANSRPAFILEAGIVECIGRDGAAALTGVTGVTGQAGDALRASLRKDLEETRQRALVERMPRSRLIARMAEREPGIR